LPQFVHLHNHSDYSLLDGAQSVEAMVKRAKELGMPAIALTEHGNVFSIIEFFKTAKKYDIKPIFGCEVYVTDNRFERKTKAHGGRGYNHMVLLAQNMEGYKNLTKLVSYGYLEGFYYKPRVDNELLRKYNKGLIATTACIQGKVQQTLLKEKSYDKAKQVALEYAEIFPDRFYLEVQNHGIEDEAIWREAAKKMSKETGIPRIVTNDAHYTYKEHWEAHDASICIGMVKDLDDPNRMRYDHEYWLKTPEEMEELFPDDDEVFANTLKIADQCNVEFKFGKYHLPIFPIPEDEGVKDADEFLTKLVFKGLEKRYEKITDEIKERAEYELQVVKEMGFAGYFLIVQDFVHYAKNNKIPVGPGRGSAAGSIICYATEITDIDPLQFDLLFERFLNPERVSMPDIDIDFCDERRVEVIDHIKKLYGEESVCQIITFGKMKAKGVIRDVGRVLKIPLSEVNRIAKLIPEGPKTTLQSALETVEDLKKISEVDEAHKKLFEISKILEGLNRHSSTHAAGVVIAPGDLTDYVPLQKPTNGDITTQFDMKCIDDIGLLKVDFLGLRNLSVIKNTIAMLKEKGIDLDVNSIPMDDELTFKLFGEGKTVGVFQFESSGMREYLKKLQPSRIEDLIAMNALYRPGPMGMIDDFIKRKKGISEIKLLDDSMEPILKDTYGIIVYQEQVMQIGSVVGGFSLGKADEMRRAMSKKKLKTLESLKVEFINGAEKKGISEKIASEIYELILKFAEYGFNKSHAAAYAVLAYKIGYLKAHYPADFMAANMTSEQNNTDRIIILADEVKKLGLKLLPPDINKSQVNFSTEGANVRYGLNGIKNMGTKAAESIVAARKKNKKFSGSFFNFVKELDLKKTNKKALECLIGAGAVDCLDGTRAQKFHSIDTAVLYAQKIQAEESTRQASLFGNSDSGNSLIAIPQLPEVTPWDEVERLNREKELTGLFLNGHPLDKYTQELEIFSNFTFTKPLEDYNNNQLKVGGIVTSISVQFDRKSRKYAFFTLENIAGKVECITFADIYEKFKDLVITDFPVFVQGKVSCRPGEDGKILVDNISPLDGLLNRQSRLIHIKLDANKVKNADIDNIDTIVRKYDGDCEIIFHLFDKFKNIKTIRVKQFKAAPHKELLATLREKYGEKNIWVE